MTQPETFHDITDSGRTAWMIHFRRLLYRKLYIKHIISYRFLFCLPTACMYSLVYCLFSISVSLISGTGRRTVLFLLFSFQFQQTVSKPSKQSFALLSIHLLMFLSVVKCWTNIRDIKYSGFGETSICSGNCLLFANATHILFFFHSIFVRDLFPFNRKMNGDCNCLCVFFIIIMWNWFGNAVALDILSRWHIFVFDVILPFGPPTFRQRMLYCTFLSLLFFLSFSVLFFFFRIRGIVKHVSECSQNKIRSFVVVVIVSFSYFIFAMTMDEVNGIKTNMNEKEWENCEGGKERERKRRKKKCKMKRSEKKPSYIFSVLPH